MVNQLPASRSVYRGQSTQGIGEGLGSQVAHGEQYLIGTSLDGGTQWLETMRPWMTLDSDQGDHEKLKDQLEAWSCFRSGERLLVARLVSAGVYDRRVTYFSHGRIWTLGASMPPGCDPGLLLGQSDAFEAPWRDGETGRRVPDRAPSMTRPHDVEASSQAAISFLAHLLQACIQKRPLIIAVPLADFLAGSPLHALVSFARGGLPAGLKRDCNVRVFTRTPELFLGHLRASLVVVPTDVASQALGVRREAFLLDRNGGRLEGPIVERSALAYAEAVLKRAVKIPEGLGLFSERFEERLSFRGLPDPDAVRAIEPTYNLAVVLAGGAEERKQLLLGYLPKAAQWLGSGEIWSRLIADREWSAFPAEALQSLVLLDTGSMSPGVRGLQEALERVLAEQGWSIDERLDEWWDEADPGKLRKLMDLLSRRLVTPAAAAARTSRIPASRLAAAGVVFAALEAEMNARMLHLRSKESAGLAEAAAVDEKVFALLTKALPVMGEEWARELVQRNGEAGFLPLARRFLEIPGFLRNKEWGGLPRQVMERLCDKRQLPADLGSLLFTAGKDLKPSENPGLYLCLAETFGRTRSSQEENGLAKRLLKDFPRPEQEEDILRFFRILDELMEQEPKETTRVLIESGWWLAWRQEPKLRHIDFEAAAMEWLACETGMVRPQAHLETWEQVVRDLPAQLAAKLFERRTWPWIPPFEEEQIRDLARKAPDLGALAVFAQTLAGSPALGNVPWYRLVLQVSEFGTDLHEDALTWLLAGMENVRPSLDSQQSRFLLKHAGDRIRTAICASLDLGASSNALDALDGNSLWVDADLVFRLAVWMNSQIDLDLAVAERIDKAVERHGAKPSRYPEQPRQELIHRLRGRGLLKALSLLSPLPLGEPETQPGNLDEEILGALRTGDSGGPCWNRLAEEIAIYAGGEDGHPLIRISRLIRKRQLDDDDVGPRAWVTFEEAVKRTGCLSGNKMTRPALSMAATLLGEGSLGSATGWIIHLRAWRGFRTEDEWWRQLIRHVRDWREHDRPLSVDECESVAFSVIMAIVKDLDEQERRSFHRAFNAEAQAAPEWKLPGEFGVMTLCAR